MHPQTAHDPIDESLPPGGGRCNHRRHIKDLPAVLDVVAVISNQDRFRSRYDLYRAFRQHIQCLGARLTTVEAAFAGRPFEVTEAGNPRHLQLRTNHTLWLKERMINLGIATLPRDWKYVAFVDADVTFSRPDVIQETLQALQHHAVVQMWSHAHDLGPDHEPIGTHRSFMSCYVESGELPPGEDDYYSRPGKLSHTWHPGFGWAMRREAVDALGGVLDFAILGSGDRHMACCLVGKGELSIYHGIGYEYRDMVMRWQDRAEKYIRRNVGFVPGLLLHHWHGKKINRRYKDRWKVLVDNNFTPSLDLKPDWQGLYQLTDRSIRLRDDIRRYFRERSEDGTET